MFLLVLPSGDLCETESLSPPSLRKTFNLELASDPTFETQLSLCDLFFVKSVMWDNPWWNTQSNLWLRVRQLSAEWNAACVPPVPFNPRNAEDNPWNNAFKKLRFLVKSIHVNRVNSQEPLSAFKSISPIFLLLNRLHKRWKCAIS